MLRNTKILTVSAIAALFGLTGVLVLAGAKGQEDTPALDMAGAMDFHAGPSSVSAEQGSAPVLRQAELLDRRLKVQQLPSPGVAALSIAIREREALLRRRLTLTLQADGAAPHIPLTASLSLLQFPGWVTLTPSYWSADVRVNRAAVQAAIEHGEIPGLPLMRPAEVLSTRTDAKKVLRAETTGIAKPGFVLDARIAAERIATAFERNLETVTLAAAYGEPTVSITGTDGTKKTFTLLGTGMSDFADSEAGREWNVHKAIEEKVHNVIIPAGETFSLVAALDAPITLEKGWKEALGLFGGGAAKTPGGGICQSATTVFRAALLAGLPIVEKKSHSLFVNHYEFYGVGLDATVFPRFHDVRFRNDTGEDILMQAYTEGVTVYVHLFGHDDGRVATLDGPYFAGTKNRNPALRPLSNSQIGWVRTITKADGTAVHEPIYATYAKPLWNYLKKYTGRGMELLTTREI